MPDPNVESASVALSAFIQGLFEKESVALARYVRCANANPKLVALIPHIKSNYFCLHLAHLPFAEDVRRYMFPSLEKAKQKVTKEMKTAVDSFIDSHDLMTAVQDDDGYHSSCIIVIVSLLVITWRLSNPNLLLTLLINDCFSVSKHEYLIQIANCQI